MTSTERITVRFWYMIPVSETDRPIIGMVVGNEKTLRICTNTQLRSQGK